MTIIIRSFKVVYDKGNNPVLVQQKIINKYSAEHDFGFDISKPALWRKWLAEYKTSTGKFLPHKSKYGDPIIYEVYNWGQSRRLVRDLGQEFFNIGNINLFPGYEKTDGVCDLQKKRDIKVYGRIR